MKITLLPMDICEDTIEELTTPFGLLYLAAYLRREMGGAVEVKILDRLSEDSFDHADMVGISSMSPFYQKACHQARLIREKYGIPVIVGGSHITALPHTLHESFDAGVIGEGEVTFLELVRLWEKAHAFRPEDLRSIKGIAYRHDGKVHLTDPRPYVAQLDEFPFPDRSLWDLTNRIIFIVSSRGCPFGCVFCAMACSHYRQASPAYVLRELAMIRETYRPKVISFMDDLFTTQTSRLREISEGIQAMGMHRDTVFSVSLRADCISEERLQLLKDMNVISVFMGIESVSPQVLKYYKADTLTVKDIERALDLCARYGILINSSFIIGSPRETPDDLYATYRFIVDNYTRKRLAGVAITVLTPYPCSRVWHHAKERGLVSDDMDWSTLHITLSRFDPYTYPYLNEMIPLEEYVDYVEMFEDLHYRINVSKFSKAYKSFRDREHHLDRALIQRFKNDVKEGRFVPPGPRSRKIQPVIPEGPAD